ncbi:transcription termination/antitermination protein NusG [Candidatus Saccharibacteria bacterium]|nr:transcription termination/antitermination protein NusG [Candidatus Saccharibacteria bacterium]MBI3337971.1 transcription termination/antitermination protein NusG [Candidatus Saccharibacteria bacterium]
MTNRYDIAKQWYAIHTYSGYEEKVAESIRQRTDSLDMKDKIFQILVPKEKMIEVKNGKRKVVEKRIFQGYVMVQMKMSEDAWYIVRNTPSVTGFVGSGSEPTPISTDEMDKIMKRMGREEPKHKIDFNIGEVVSITDGPFKSFDGTISEVDATKGKLKVLVNMFGRETPVELDSLQVKRV